jgi:hypothetical protein
VRGIRPICGEPARRGRTTVEIPGPARQAETQSALPGRRYGSRCWLDIGARGWGCRHTSYGGQRLLLGPSPTSRIRVGFWELSAGKPLIGTRGAEGGVGRKVL